MTDSLISSGTMWQFIVYWSSWRKAFCCTVFWWLSWLLFFISSQMWYFYIVLRCKYFVVYRISMVLSMVPMGCRFSRTCFVESELQLSLLNACKFSLNRVKRSSQFVRHTVFWIWKKLICKSPSISICCYRADFYFCVVLLLDCCFECYF